MRKQRLLAGLVLAAIPALTFAAVPTITDNEEHVFRGFFDRQSSMIALDRIALTKGSADIKTFAQQELDMYAKFAADLGKLGDKFGLITRGMTGGTSPKLGQGETRGFEKLPEGATWFSKGQFADPLAMSASMQAPQGGAAQGGAPQGGAPSGAAPGGAAGGMAAGGGAQQNRYDYDSAELAKLSDKDFDKQYLLRVSVAHNAMLRHVSTSINEPGANPEMVEFAKNALKTLVQQNQKIESLLNGQGLSAGPGGGMAAGQGAAPGGAPQGGAPGTAPAAR